MFVLFSQLSAYRPFVYGVDDASSKLAQADNAVTGAFVAVETAQEAGADVSALLTKVNDANAILAEAHTAFRSGNNETASLKSDQAFNAVQSVVNEAESLKRSAESDSQGKLVWTALFSSVGLSLLFVACLFGWSFFKRRYIKQALEKRPAKVDKV
jgi:hypothetical protein